MNGGPHVGHDHHVGVLQVARHVGVRAWPHQVRRWHAEVERGAAGVRQRVGSDEHDVEVGARSMASRTTRSTSRRSSCRVPTYTATGRPAGRSAGRELGAGRCSTSTALGMTTRSGRAGRRDCGQTGRSTPPPSRRRPSSRASRRSDPLPEPVGPAGLGPVVGDVVGRRPAGRVDQPGVARVVDPEIGARRSRRRGAPPTTWRRRLRSAKGPSTPGPHLDAARTGRRARRSRAGADPRVPAGPTGGATRARRRRPARRTARGGSGRRPAARARGTGCAATPRPRPRASTRRARRHGRRSPGCRAAPTWVGARSTPGQAGAGVAGGSARRAAEPGTTTRIADPTTSARRSESTRPAAPRLADDVLGAALEVLEDQRPRCPRRWPRPRGARPRRRPPGPPSRRRPAARRDRPPRRTARTARRTRRPPRTRPAAPGSTPPPRSPPNRASVPVDLTHSCAQFRARAGGPRARRQRRRRERPPGPLVARRARRRRGATTASVGSASSAATSRARSSGSTDASGLRNSTPEPNRDDAPRLAAAANPALTGLAITVAPSGLGHGDRLVAGCVVARRPAAAGSSTAREGLGRGARPSCG